MLRMCRMCGICRVRVDEAGQGTHAQFGPSIPNVNIAPLFVKMAQNLDLRCVLVPAPWVLGPKHFWNPE